MTADVSVAGPPLYYGPEADVVLFGSAAAEMRIGIALYVLFRPQQSFRLKPVIKITTVFTGAL